MWQRFGWDLFGVWRPLNESGNQDEGGLERLPRRAPLHEARLLALRDKDRTAKEKQEGDRHIRKLCAAKLWGAKYETLHKGPKKKTSKI